MRFNVAAAALSALLIPSACSKEDLLRRRDVAVKWTYSGVDEGRATNDFYQGPDWGASQSDGNGYDSKSSKSSKSYSPKSSKSYGPKSSKSKGPKSYSSKGPKSSKPPHYRPPPHYTPVPNTPPQSPPTKCPEYDFEGKVCTAGSGNAKECPIDSSCKPACVPKYCKLPPNDPHKVHGYSDGIAGNQYVKLGSVCGYFHYVEGMEKPRHAVEVCCVVDDNDRSETNHLEYGKCDGCGACKYPQKVNDACCKIALGRSEDVGRDGDYSPECDSGVCCKCGSGDGPESYACIGPHDVCSESSCQDQCPVVKDVRTPNLLVNEVNEAGFGDINNKYSLGMATFGDFVYVGTLNAPGFPLDLLPWFSGLPLGSTGAKVYRGKSGLDGKWKWEEVHDFGLHNPNNFGIRKMLVVGDYLYLVTANHEGITAGNGAEVWQTKDGVTWMQKSAPGFGEPSNISGRTLAKCGDYLYVGVENRVNGAELWRHVLSVDGGMDGYSWQKVPVASGGFGNANNFAISDLAVVASDSLYAGTLNSNDGMELWRITSCNAITPAGVGVEAVFIGGWPGPECPLPPIGPKNLCATNSGVLTLKAVGSMLFLGTVNYFLGASLFVSFDGIEFLPVFIFGNGNDGLNYVWSMEIYRDRLYIGTFARPSLKDFNFPGGINIDLDMTGPLEDIDPQDFVEFFEILQQLGFSLDSPGLPAGLTPDVVGEIDLEAVIGQGSFTLFSLDPRNPFEVAVETTDAFGSCYPTGVRTMSVYGGSLLLGTSGASREGGTLIFEAKGIV